MEMIVAAFKAVWRMRFAAIFLFPPLSASHQAEPFYFSEVYLHSIGRHFELKLVGVKARAAQ